VGLEATAALAVAALDLNLVRLLRAAMRPGGPCGCGPLDLIHPGARFEPRKRVEPTPLIEPRPHVRPEPVFEPRMKVRGAGGAECCGGCAQVAPAAPEAAPRPLTSPLEPPWKVRPWEDRAVADRPRPVRKIKVVMTRSDSYCKGSVIDLFI
jgi:hypothetical protein